VTQLSPAFSCPYVRRSSSPTSLCRTISVHLRSAGFWTLLSPDLSPKCSSPVGATLRVWGVKKQAPMHPPGPGVGSVPSCVSASDPHGAGQPGPTKENWGELGGNHIDTPASQQATGTPHRRTSGTDSEPLWPHTPIDLHKRLRGPYSRIRTNDALQVQMPCADPQEISPRPTPQHRCLVAMAIVGWHGRASHRAWKRVPGRTSFHPPTKYTLFYFVVHSRLGPAPVSLERGSRQHLPTWFSVAPIQKGRNIPIKPQSGQSVNPVPAGAAQGVAYRQQNGDWARAGLCLKGGTAGWKIAPGGRAKRGVGDPEGPPTPSAGLGGRQNQSTED
jgi:hypothetical protein